VSVLLPSALLLQEHITRHAADTIPTHRATRAVIERSVSAAPYPRSGAGVGCLAGSNAPGLRGRTGWKLSFSTRHERCLVGVKSARVSRTGGMVRPSARQERCWSGSLSRALPQSRHTPSGGLSIDRSTWSRSPAGLPELHIRRTPPPPVELPNPHSRKRSIT
jgi:hypothetical protein